MDSFYVVLPSNSGDVEGNTTSKFTVRMPDTLELDSSWTVALSNIIYPFSFSLLGDSDEQESITIYRRYGKELLSVRIELPDLSFASEEALEEAINAVLLDAWKKELDREREEMRLEENKKRIYGNLRRRRAVETIGEQLVKNGKQGIRLPPIRPHEVDGIAMVRFTPNQDQIERIKQALDEFTNPPSASQTEEEHSNVTPMEETRESTPQTQHEVEQKTILPAAEYESFIQQLETEGYFDMPKDRAYKFIQYLNKEIKGAKLPVLSSVPDSSVETVRLKPQTEQKDIIINAIKRFESPSAPKSENPLQEASLVDNADENPETDTPAPSQSTIKNLHNGKTESSTKSDSSITNDPPITKSPVITVSDAPTEAPVASEEKVDDTQQDTEKQKDKTPLDGKITPLSDTLPTLTDEQKTLIDMAVRAATRSLTNSEELAKQQSQLNKELNQKYWEDTRYKYALIDAEVTAGVIPKRKIPATIIKWVIAQLKLLVGRRNEIDKWIQECLEAKDRVSEAQKETKKSESRGDVTEARKAADRAKASEQKVKELANQVDEAIAGQKILSEEILSKVEAELSKQDDETSSSKITTPDSEESSTHKEENSENKGEHESINEEEPKESSEDKQENAKEPHEEENMEEEAGSIDKVAEEPSENKYEEDEEPSAHAEEENADEEHEQEDFEEPQGTSEDTQENAKEPSTHEEENIEDKAESTDEVAEEQSEDTQEKDKDPLTIVEDENIEPHEENEQEVADTPEENDENTQEKDEDNSTNIEEDENIESREEHETINEKVTETSEETSEEILENVQESTTDEDEKTIEPREEIEQEVTEEHVESSKEKIQEFPGVIDEDEEPWTPPLEEPVPNSIDNLEDNVSHELPTINEEDAVEPWSPEKESLGKPQESPSIINKEVAWTPPEKVSNLPSIEEEPEQEEIQPEDLGSLPELPRPEMLIADPPERPSFWKSFFGDGGRHIEDKTKEKELPHQENVHQQKVHQQKESEVLNDSEPKKIHLAEYAYPPEYLKMLLNFSNIQLADPKYQWVSILYDKLHKRFYVFLQGNVQFIKLSRQLAYTLGFDSEKIHSGQVAKYMPDISGGVRQFLVYAPKLVENSIIGNVTAPLLRVVNVSGGPGESISEVYMTEHHHRLLGKRHPDITIEIRTLTGKLVKFHWGTCILTLHFQRSLF
uniref:Uncharacterized protein n=1 Tax=Meloidogyne incognita TaxID=6306 RepID=A0A914M036_MELIC